MILLRTITISVLVLGASVATYCYARPGQDKSNITMVYIIRHAEKVDESSNADLSEKGLERAKMLKWMLRDVKFDEIYSTNVPRTKNTVASIAKSRGLKIIDYSPGHMELSKRIRKKSQALTILVSGHSNTIPRLLAELGTPIKEKILKGFDDLFVVIINRDENNTVIDTILHRLHYPGK